MRALVDAGVDDLQQVEGVGPERAVTIAAELAELAPLIAKLAERGVNMAEPGVNIGVNMAEPGVNIAEPGGAAGPTAAAAPVATLPLRKPDGSPMTVVVTGSVPGLTRDEGNEAVETLGGRSSGSVSKRTDLVVVGDGAGSKAEKAKQLGVRILPADRFAALLDAYRAGDADTVTEILAVSA
jgi:DNA ligase (NAD+)